jgi:DNA adenine methylase
MQRAHTKSQDRYLISWVGGKRLLRKTIAPLVPAGIELYAEPFGGAGWMLFYKDCWAGSEIYNDLDGRLVNLFRTVKYHHDELIREMSLLINSRELFYQVRDNKGMTDIQRAARFLFLIKKSFGAMGETFGCGRKPSASGLVHSTLQIRPQIEAIHARLDKVLVENLDFEELIRRYDSKGSFFYCDPPYTSGTGYAVATAEGFAHKRLRRVLEHVKGRWLLSYDDSAMVRELYRGFPLLAVSRRKGINNKNPHGRIYREVLIANYPINKRG